jgi:RNA polymerase sigma-70 factor (ECF subfamily)
VTDPIDNLFRRESGRLVAALTRILGVGQLALAEDAVQEALCRALETWKLRGVPENPSAWIIATAKNCAIDVLRRERTTREQAPELARLRDAEELLAHPTEELFAGAALADDQLRMIFSCCHPRLPEEAQVALVLQILCGFSVAEIAEAFLCGAEAIQKRVSRGRAQLAGARRLFELSDEDFVDRLAAVQRALYLLFNEGYHGGSAQAAVRRELCDEAMRLTSLLCDDRRTATPATWALLALMCFHAARLPARTDAAGDFQSLDDQDRSRWDRSLIEQGELLLAHSARGVELSPYHVEAGIAALHASAASVAETPWSEIVGLYDTLLALRPSPVVALQRALAIAERDGPARGLDEIAQIADRERLAEWPFLSAALGELELRCGHADLAGEHFRAAIALARNPNERRFLERRAAAARSRKP